jgi:O-antigen/teichoic acid export membrane protein
MGNEGYGHILKYTGLFGGVQGLGILLNLVRNKFVAVLLGPAGMGLVSIYTTAMSFFSQATNLGLSFSAVRHLSEAFERGDSKAMERVVRVVRCWVVLTALAGMLLFMLASPLLSRVFSIDDHTIHFVLLSPIVAMMALTGGETAILKSSRKLGSLAVVQLGSVVAALLVSVPLYWRFGMGGIVPVLLLVALSTLLLTARRSLRLYPLQFGGARGLLGEGMGMVRLGVAFVLAGIMGSGAEVAIRSFLNMGGELDAVGLYNAGYVLTITYAGMVFSAMETDYFPRLSAVNRDTAAVNLMANRQMEVSLLLVSPLLALLIVLLPVFVPLLFSGRFAPAVAMAQVAAFSMYFKAASLPVSYITLAKGDSRAYFLLESVFDVSMVLLVIGGYHCFGLWGAGAALSVAYLLELLLVVGWASARYGFRLSPSVLRYMLAQYPLGMAVYVFAVFPWPPLVEWGGCALAIVASGAVSLYVLMYKKTSLWDNLKRKFRGRG